MQQPDLVFRYAATVVSFVELLCPLPPSPLSSESNSAVNTWNISVSNDGQTYSNALQLTVYDSKCLECQCSEQCRVKVCSLNNAVITSKSKVGKVRQQVKLVLCKWSYMRTVRLLNVSSFHFLISVYFVFTSAFGRNKVVITKIQLKKNVNAKTIVMEFGSFLSSIQAIIFSFFSTKNVPCLLLASLVLAGKTVSRQRADFVERIA